MLRSGTSEQKKEAESAQDGTAWPGIVEQGGDHAGETKKRLLPQGLRRNAALPTARSPLRETCCGYRPSGLKNEKFLVELLCVWSFCYSSSSKPIHGRRETQAGTESIGLVTSVPLPQATHAKGSRQMPTVWGT